MRKMIFMAVSATLVLAAAVFCYEKSSSMISNPFDQLEVLTENTGEEGNLDPAGIMCDDGRWGWCLTKDEHDTGVLRRYCRWTGYQEDYCPWWWHIL